MLSSQQSSAQNYTKSGNNYVATLSVKTKSEPIKTKFTYTDTHGDRYDIYIGKTGACYYNKISSRTNKSYRVYLGEEISRDICKQLGIEYTSKSKKK